MNEVQSTTRPMPRGILLVDKPVGPTSMDVCRRVRTACRRGGLDRGLKVGHGGTLDPMATGLVVVLIGKATRLCDFVMAGTKEYVTDVDLGHTSATWDLESEPTPVVGGRVPTNAEVAEACTRFEGLIEQRPPAHSAVHIGGRRAYELARKGAEVVMPVRQVQIDRVELIRYEWPIATIRIVCGKGTYIRSLARDLGASLGLGGLLRSLRRTKSGRFTVDAAHRMGELPEIIRQEHLIDVDEAGEAVLRG